MKKYYCAIVLLFCSAIVYSYGRSGDLADPSFLTTGDEALCFSVSVDTSTPVLVYDSNSTGKWDREILLQNTSSDYDIWCGTFSAVSSTSDRFLLPKKPSGFTTNGRYDIYCIVEPSAGSTTIDVTGVVEFDSRD